jgi:geranylgeranyl diphosphate synthase type II
MTRESVEGQALELEWVRKAEWDLSDEDYVRMVEQKTCWYSFITPVMIGAIATRLDLAKIDALTEFARRLGVAFQIQDDILNLAGDVGEYGKEIGGDLWEGKRTLILLHALRTATPEDRAEATRILALPRPGAAQAAESAPELDATLDALVEAGELTRGGRDRMRAAIEAASSRRARAKTPDEVRFLRSLAERHGSIDHARAVASAWAGDAQCAFDACAAWLLPGAHRDVLQSLIQYVIERVR